MSPSKPSSPQAMAFPILAALVATLLIGCSRSPTLSPLAPREDAHALSVAAGAAGYGSGSFYPLTFGYEWDYEGGGSLRAVSGDGVPHSDFSYRFTERHRLIGTTHHEGTQYFVEEQIHHSIPEDFYGPVTYWSRMRQDRAGLFFLDTLLLAPPALDGARLEYATAGENVHPFRIDEIRLQGLGSDAASIRRLADRVEMLREAVRGIVRDVAPSGLELRELVYPLRPGLNWSIRPDFPWPVTVVGIGPLDTPAGRFTAYRLSVNPFGTTIHAGEWIYLWYSREGYLGYSIHTFLKGTGPDGEPTGVTYVADESMRVTTVQVAR